MALNLERRLHELLEAGDDVVVGIGGRLGRRGAAKPLGLAGVRASLALLGGGGVDGGLGLVGEEAPEGGVEAVLHLVIRPAGGGGEKKVSL